MASLYELSSEMKHSHSTLLTGRRTGRWSPVGAVSGKGGAAVAVLATAVHPLVAKVQRLLLGACKRGRCQLVSPSGWIQPWTYYSVVCPPQRPASLAQAVHPRCLARGGAISRDGACAASGLRVRHIDASGLR